MLGFKPVTNLAAPTVMAPGVQRAVEGASQSFNLGSFSTFSGDAGPFGVDVDWGDGSPHTTFWVAAAGTITAQPHSYAEEGSYVPKVTVTDFLSLSGSATAPAISVSDPAVLPTGGFTVTAAEGANSGSQTVATFTDPGGPEAVGNYSADSDRGDGTGTQAGAGTISFSGGVFTVKGSHTYAEEGGDTITVTIHHETATDAQTTSTAKVSSVAIGQGPCDPDTLLIGGTQAGDTIVVSPVGNTGGVKVQINNEPAVIVAAGTFSSIAVYGQDGDDDIQIAGSIKYSAFLFGQGGNDRLKGGKGNNLLVGGAGDDTLTGDNSSGFSVLIGGTGSDRLVGNGGDDLLITGVVDFEDPLNCDNNPLLCNLLHSWAVPTQGYAARSAAVGTLLAGHVVDDHAPDTLTGSSGQDLFYISVGDTITGKKSNEIVVIV